MRHTPILFSKLKVSAVFFFRSIKYRRSSQLKQPWVYIGFLIITAFMLISSVQYWAIVVLNPQLSAQYHLLNVAEYIKNTIGIIFGVIILNDLRFVVPTQWMTFKIENNKTKLDIKQHFISSLIVLTPIVIFVSIIFYLTGFIK